MASEDFQILLLTGSAAQQPMLQQLFANIHVAHNLPLTLLQKLSHAKAGLRSSETIMSLCCWSMQHHRFQLQQPHIANQFALATGLNFAGC